jgi:tricarballylate dehydrogenase
MEAIGGEAIDVIVVGAGNAATCAALSAQENGARVVMLEVAPEDQRAGNSAFTGGAFRVVYHGFDDLARLIPDISEHELSNVDVGTYTEEQYFDDMGRLTQYRCDPDPDPQQLRDWGVDARQGRALSARARPAGVSGRWQV